MNKIELFYEEMDEWDSVFNEVDKPEYSHDQLIRFADLWSKEHLKQYNKILTRKQVMKAVGKYVLVKEIKESHKSQGGLLLTSKDTVGMMYRKGEVVSFGVALNYLKEGNYIYYNKLQTHEVRIDEDLYTVVQDKDIVVVL